MNSYSDELRLLWTLLLNGGVFCASYLFARRRGAGDILQAVCDAFLLYFLTQYAAIAIPGVFGILNAVTMTLVALLAIGLMSAGVRFSRNLSYGIEAPRQAPARSPVRDKLGKKNSGQKPMPPWWTADRLALLSCALFAGGYLAAYAWSQRPMPPVATDALVYHLPMAVQWLQTHRLGIYPSWYWNPAASYSPANGSTFMAWWIAPAGNDVFVRFVQLPPLIFVFFLVVRMCRLMGCSRTLGGLIAVAVTLSRPLFSEAIFPKDDLYVTAFVAAAVLSLAREPIQDWLGAWRVGIALGMVLASKYTVLLACPVFLFLIDSPFRARWRMRQWLIAVAIVALLALPWYVRNTLLTGNPLYPVDVHLPGVHFNGLFTTERDQQLRTAGGIWDMLSGRYHSLPRVLILMLLAGWVLACVGGRQVIVREPLPRACVIGSVATLILFLVTSPHHEVRYIFPLLVLLFAAVGFGLGRLSGIANAVAFIAPSPPYSRKRVGVRGHSVKQRNPRNVSSPYPSPLSTAERGPEHPRAFPRSAFGNGASIVIALAIASISTLTSFSTELIKSTIGLAATALLVAAVGVGMVTLQTRVLRLGKERAALLVGFAAMALATAAYVEWHPYVEAYRQTRMVPWNLGYPRQAGPWQWVDAHVPEDGTVAYANTYFVYPYYGFNLKRHVGYAPVRKGLHDFLNFPRMGERVPGDLIVRRMTEVMNTDADRATWMENLRAMKAEYLVVMKPDPGNTDFRDDPPELKFAREEPKVFVPVAEMEGGTVLRIRPSN